MNDACGFYRLYNQIKHYEWGSREFIPAFLGLENIQNLPWAEMWMGSHPGAPSGIEKNGNKTSLGDLIAENPAYFLGKKGAQQYGQLPFLYKLIAAGKPLSIQAHPDIRQAREGFERENRAGLSLDDPKRNYRDPNHKPEILCALVPLTLMCGFRKPAEIIGFLETFASAAPQLREIFSPLLTSLRPQTKSLEEFFRALFALTNKQRGDLSAFILEKGDIRGGIIRKKISHGEYGGRGGRGGEGGGEEGEEGGEGKMWKLIHSFAELYPGDPAVLSPLYLNLLTLAPTEAIFVNAGILHAYISGFGVELMANSDNVLRGGLTPKHIDIPELLNILDFNPFKPDILKAPESVTGIFRYPSGCDEFSLSIMRSANGKTAFTEEGPAICIVTEGELIISDKTFKKGESVFIPAGGKDSSPLFFAGNYCLYVAALGGS